MYPTFAIRSSKNPVSITFKILYYIKEKGLPIPFSFILKNTHEEAAHTRAYKLLRYTLREFELSGRKFSRLPDLRGGRLWIQYQQEIEIEREAEEERTQRREMGEEV